MYVIPPQHKENESREQKKKKREVHRKHEYKQVFVRKDITDQDEKERRDIFGQIEKEVIIRTDRPALRDTDRWKICIPTH